MIDDWSVVTRTEDSGAILPPFWFTRVPEKVKLDTPFPSSPSVIKYCTVTVSPSSSLDPCALPNFLPKIPSPKINSYLSSCISLIKNILDSDVTSFNSVAKLYFIPIPLSPFFLIDTLIVDESIFWLSNINLWSNDPSYKNTCDK